MIFEAKNEGINQGIKQDNIETARKMLNEKCDIELISKVTNLSFEEINSIKD